jgi:TetR/AcrR family transcriptional regulator, mexJK operon transcriptional repressor
MMQAQCIPAVYRFARPRSAGRSLEPVLILKGRERKKSASKAGRPTSDELERRKQRVIEAATQLFVDHGYAATSLVDIARKAGVATRTIYQHFGDKADMFREVIFSRDNAPHTEPPGVSPEDSLYTSLMRIAHYTLEISLNPKTVKLMRLMVSETERFADLTRKVANTSYEVFYGSIQTMFAELHRLGRIPADDHLQTAKFFADFILGATPFYTIANWVNQRPTDLLLSGKVELFIRGRFGAEVAKHAHLAELPRTKRASSRAVHAA